MKIRIRYEESFQTIEADLEEMWVMLSLSGEEGMSGEEREKLVQEAVDEQFNRPEYNNLHKLKRHWSDGTTPRKLDGRKGFVSRHSLPHEQMPDSIEMYPDEGWERAFCDAQDYEELSRLLHRILPPGQADVLMRVHVDGYRIKEVAAEEGVSCGAVCQRLRRAEENFRKIFPSPLIFHSSHG